MAVAVLEFGRVELNGVVHDRLQSWLRQLLHGQEPLETQARLNHGVGALASPHFVGVILHLHQIPKAVEFFGEGLAAFKPVHSLVGPSLRRHRAVGVDGVDGLEVVLLSKLVVVDVVRRGHLQTPCAKLDVDVIVGDDGDFAVDDRHHGLLAHKVFVPLVVRMDANGGVTHDGLGAGGRHCHPTVFFPHNGVTHVVQLAVLLGVDDLFIAQGRQGGRVPVHHAYAPINQPTLVELHEGVDDPFVVAFIHREPRAVPIATRAEFFQLLEDDAPVLVGPLPRMF